jgi:hypothetical protein
MNTTTITTAMLEKLDHKKQVAFAVFCAKQVKHLVKEEHKLVVNKAIEVAEGFAFGNVSKDECLAARAAAHAAAHAAHAAGAAAYAATYAAAYAATHAAYAAGDAAIHAAYAAGAATHAAYAAGDAAGAARAAHTEQIRYYEELLNFDSLIENSLFK